MPTNRVRFSEVPVDKVPPRGFVDVRFNRTSGTLESKDRNGATSTIGSGASAADEFLGVLTVAELPSPSVDTLGKRAVVTDIYSYPFDPLYGSPISTGGGEFSRMAFCDGTHWRVG